MYVSCKDDSEWESENIAKKSNEIKKMIFEIEDIFLFFDLVKNKEIIKIKGDIFSIFNPMNIEEIVVAILLPNIIPILSLKVKILAFIIVRVNRVTAELDCISRVVQNPVAKELL